MIYRNARAEHLAAFRIAVLMFWVVDLARRPLADLTALPSAWFQPHGPWLLVPAAVIEALWTPVGLNSLKWVTVGVAAAVAAGVPGRKGLSALLVVLLTLVTGFVRGFGHPDHADVQLLMLTIALMFTPAWDAWRVRFSSDEGQASETTAQLERHPSQQPVDANMYAASFATLALVFSFPYFMTGAYRLAKEGLSLYFGPSILHFLARDSMVLDDFTFGYGLWLAEQSHWLPLYNLSFVGVSVAEMTAPWAHLSRKGCALWLAVILPFHLLTPLLMHIIFVQNMAVLVLLYVVPLVFLANVGPRR